MPRADCTVQEVVVPLEKRRALSTLKLIGTFPEIGFQKAELYANLRPG